MATPKEKTMSSRLLTMKFMQRAAASEPSSATSSANNTPDRPSKRPRMSNGAHSSSPARPSSDLEAVRQAMAAEEAKRAQAVERQALESGESRWVLSFQDPSAGADSLNTNDALKIVTGGYADIDDSDEEHVGNGRLNFGKKVPDAGEESGSSDDSEEEDSEGEVDENDPVSSLLHEERRKASEDARQKLKERKKKRDQKMNEYGDERRKKKVRLNGRSNTGLRALHVNEICTTCNEPGHKAKGCPRNRTSSRPLKEYQY